MAYSLQHLQTGYSKTYEMCVGMNPSEYPKKSWGHLSLELFKLGYEMHVLALALKDGVEQLKGRCQLCGGTFTDDELTETILIAKMLK